MTPIGPIELLPCLHCGKIPDKPESFEYLGFNEDCDEFAIMCRSCGAIGPTVYGHEWDTADESNFPKVLAECTEAWNRRAPQPKDKCPRCGRTSEVVNMSECPFCKPKEPRKWKPDDVVGFCPGAIFGETGRDIKFCFLSPEVRTALNASEERDFTPEEALEEARKRWGSGAVISVQVHADGKINYWVGMDVCDCRGLRGNSFRAAFASADKASQEKGKK
jgi:hypothetical protein